MKVSEGMRSTLASCITELLLNTTEHSKSGLGAFVCGDTFEAQNEVRISVTDLGIGFRASLSQNPRYRRLRTNRAAISKAVLEEGASGPGKDRMERGLGLSWLRRLVKANSGCLSILSHDGHVNFWASKTESHRLRRFLPVTSVNLRIKMETDNRYSLGEEKELF